MAMIQVKREDPKIFRVGDEVANAVFLESIQSDRVTLRRDDQFEVLALAKMGGEKANVAQKDAPKPPKKKAKKKEPIVANSADE